jgi:Putative zinc-finger/Fervidolysin N-terminal prodomain
VNEPRVVVRLDAERHRAVQALLPWHAAQTLDADERERVEAHLAECPRCQADLAFERRLQAAHRALDGAPAHDVERDWARLTSRLDEPAPSRGAGLRAAVRRWREGWQALGANVRRVLVTQCALIAALGVVLGLALPFGGVYRALGAGPANAQGNLLVMFRAEASEAQLRAALQAAGARVVDGPTAAGAWLLAVPAARKAAALESLRAQPTVRLAEPLAERSER